MTATAIITATLLSIKNAIVRLKAGETPSGDRAARDPSSATRRGGDLRDLRRLRGLSQKTLAERSGVSDSTIRRIERGTHRPRLITLMRLAEALGVHVDRLLK